MSSPAEILSLMLMLLLALSIMSPMIVSSMDSTINSFRRSVVVYAPAVTHDGEGSVLRINLTLVYPGSGMVYFSARPLIEPDVQAAARIAAYVASTITGRDFYSYDYYVVMTSSTLVVGGPSAGGLMTVGFISLFINKSINKSVTMAGMINPDGSIGPVGGLLAKLQAVSRSGFKYFLIPAGQRIVYVEQRTVKKVIWDYYETIEYVPVDLVEEGRKLNVTVIEVGNIFDAMKYFLGITVKPIRSENIVMNDEVLEAIGRYAYENYVKSIELFNESVRLFSLLDSSTKIQMYGQLKSVEMMNNELRYFIENSLTIISFIYSHDVLRENLYTNWLYKLMLGELDLDNVTSMINETINNMHDELAVVGNGLNPLLIESHTLYYQATSKYSELLGKNSTSYTTEDIEKLADVAVKLYFSNQLLNISSIFTREHLNTTDAFTTLYSLSDSVISYAYSLANDIGESNQYIIDAMTCFKEALNAYTNNHTVVAIGLLIDSIVHADIGIKALFIQNSTVYANITEYLMREHLIYYNITTVKDYMAYTFTASKEYASINNYVNSTCMLLKGIMYALLFTSNNTPSFIPVEIESQKPLKQPINDLGTRTETPTYSAPVNESVNETNILATNMTASNLIYYVLGIITGFALGIVAHYVYSITRKRRVEQACL